MTKRSRLQPTNAIISSSIDFLRRVDSIDCS